MDTKASYDGCHSLIEVFEEPSPQLQALLERYAAEVDGERKKLVEQAKKDKEAKLPTDKQNTARRKVLDEQSRLIRRLELEISRYQSANKQVLQNYKQWLKDWHHLQLDFPDKCYQNVEGLCKVVDLDEVEENDWSLTPGHYVGFKVQIDEDFDYKGRVKEIQGLLLSLNNEANTLMKVIQEAEL